MNDVLPGRDRSAPQISGVAVLAGVLVSYGAYAILISIVAAFANGAHSHQVLSGATFKQLGTGGGIVAGIVLFLAWGAGGFVAARMAGRDGLRHGVWVFVAGVVLMTVVSAAITWLPGSTAVLRNLRLLGLPLRRGEWRDVATVGGLASLIGAAAGAAAGGWYALREAVPRPAAAPAPAPAPAAAPTPAPAVTSAPGEPFAEPAFAGSSLLDDTGFEPDRLEEPTPEPVFGSPFENLPAPQESEDRPVPAWLEYVQDRERAIQERELVSEFEGGFAGTAEPAPTFIQDEEAQASQPLEQPVEQQAPSPAAEDRAWALPDDQGVPAGGDEEMAFPPAPPVPVPEPTPEPAVVDVTPPPYDAAPFQEPPPAPEPLQWEPADDLYRAPPESAGQEELQAEPEAPAPEVDEAEREERRRQQEEAARAYERAREDDNRPPLS
ncbi:MAG: TIGR04086 family membrane protein [Acidimicrobiia bacterium]|nr:TIGR04086 family membrane protein [Acidimicrobiia bacterium]